MTHSTKKRIERLLRKARLQVFNNPELEEVIEECKQLLAPVWKQDYNSKRTKRLENWLLVN